MAKPRECKRGRFHKPPHIAPFHHPKAYKENPHAHIAPKDAQPTCVKEVQGRMVGEIWQSRKFAVTAPSKHMPLHALTHELPVANWLGLKDCE